MSRVRHSGGRRVGVVLDRDAARHLDSVTSATGETVTAAVRRAIMGLATG